MDENHHVNKLYFSSIISCFPGLISSIITSTPIVYVPANTYIYSCILQFLSLRGYFLKDQGPYLSPKHMLRNLSLIIDLKGMSLSGSRSQGDQLQPYKALVQVEVNTSFLGKGRLCYFAERESIAFNALEYSGEFGDLIFSGLFSQMSPIWFQSPTYYNYGSEYNTGDIGPMNSVFLCNFGTL